MVEGLCVFQAQAEGSRGCELHSVLVLHLGENWMNGNRLVYKGYNNDSRFMIMIMNDNDENIIMANGISMAIMIMGVSW